MPKQEPLLNICQFFRAQSQYAWGRIAFARKMNLRISETTMTEELLYHFYQYFESFSVPIRLFESKEEHRNGSDIEVLVHTTRGYILLACQAKITYKTGNYRSFHHEVGGARQIDLLVDYATRHGGIPQYLLYNFIPEWMMMEPFDEIEIPEDYGITHVQADKFIDWMEDFSKLGKKPPVPHFNTFHTGMAQPFHELICQLLSDKVVYEPVTPEDKLSALTYYDESDFKDEVSWRQITSLAHIGLIEEASVYQEIVNEANLQRARKNPSPPIYKPKFKLVIGGANSGGAIYLVK